MPSNATPLWAMTIISRPPVEARSIILRLRWSILSPINEDHSHSLEVFICLLFIATGLFHHALSINITHPLRLGRGVYAREFSENLLQRSKPFLHDSIYENDNRNFAKVRRTSTCNMPYFVELLWNSIWLLYTKFNIKVEIQFQKEGWKQGENQWPPMLAIGWSILPFSLVFLPTGNS